MHTNPPRPGDPDIPPYRFVAKPNPDNYGAISGCYGCAFRHRPDIRCSRIPCHVGVNKGMVAELIPQP